MRRWTGGIGLASLAFVSGCYTYVPVESPAPAVGEAVALEITDQGRVALADRLGPGVLRIEGRVLGTEGEQMLISVGRIVQVNGQVNLWSGESMRLDRSLVGRTQTRRIDQKRTWLAAAVSVAAVAALVAIADLGGFFDGGDAPPDDPPPHSIRPSRTRVISPGISGSQP